MTCQLSISHINAFIVLYTSGVFTAALVIYFKPEWAIIDPICTFIFSVLVLATTISILRNTLEVLMEAAPAGISHDVVEVSIPILLKGSLLN